MNTSLYSYPIRGFGMVAIYLVLGPVLITIAGVFIEHAWQGGADLLLEIVDVFQNEARPRLLSGYSYYMPSIFLAGIFCSLPVSRGLGLSLSSALWRTVLVIVLVEFVLRLLANGVGETVLSEQNMNFIFFTVIQALVVALFCWILSTGFRLDKDVKIS